MRFCPAGIKQKTCLHVTMCLCANKAQLWQISLWASLQRVLTYRCLGHSLELLAVLANMPLGRSFMLLKSEFLTAVPGAQGYHSACTCTPYHPEPAVHGVFLIAKFVTCSDVAYLLTTERGNDSSINPIRSAARNSLCWWHRYRWNFIADEEKTHKWKTSVGLSLERRQKQLVVLGRVASWKVGLVKNISFEATGFCW